MWRLLLLASVIDWRKTAEKRREKEEEKQEEEDKELFVLTLET
jgi:hypothetical protein